MKGMKSIHKKSKKKQQVAVETNKINSPFKSSDIPDIPDIPYDDNKHPEDDIAYGVTNEILTHCLNVAKKHLNESMNENGDGSNTSILRPVLDRIMNTIINKIAPYLYSIMAILIVMFFMNCFQFYYYIRIILTKNVIRDTSFV
jgi:hypothetical protein